MSDELEQEGGAEVVEDDGLDGQEEMTANVQDYEDPLLGQVFVDKYAIKSKLGEGGFGAVYSAEQLVVGREVAVKVLRAALTSQGDDEALALDSRNANVYSRRGLARKHEHRSSDEARGPPEHCACARQLLGRLRPGHRRRVGGAFCAKSLLRLFAVKRGLDAQPRKLKQHSRCPSSPLGRE